MPDLTSLPPVTNISMQGTSPPQKRKAEAFVKTAYFTLQWEINLLR